MALLEEKVAIVTGASSGIGLATVKACLNAGAYVLGVDISPAPDLTHSRFQFLQQDLTSPSAASTVVSACVSAFNGRIDALLNVAGIMDNFSSVATLDDSHWEKVMAIDVTAPTRLMRAVVDVIKKQKSGSIVNVASKAGTSGATAGVAYTASKHALVGVTKNTAWMLKEEGIRCNAIIPGAVLSGLSTGMDTQADVESFMKIKTVLSVHTNVDNPNAWATPDVPADVLVFLASDLSRDINGAIVPVDQAWSCI